MSSSENFSLPQRMPRDGREVDQDFDPEEKVYQRFNKLKSKNGTFYPSAIRFPDFSVNRDKYSEPKDVLLHNYPEFMDWGVASFKVDDLPDDMTTGVGTPNETVYSFDVVHDPLDKNYSHSEVRTFKNDYYDEDMSVNPKKVKLRFRIQIGKSMVVEKEPEEPSYF